MKFGRFSHHKSKKEKDPKVFPLYGNSWVPIVDALKRNNIECLKRNSLQLGGSYW